MERKGRKWGFVIVGAVAAVALGAIAVASAATTQSASPSPSASDQAGSQAHTPDFDGDGPQGGRDGGPGGHGGGAPDMATALAKLTGKDVSTIMQARESGKTFKQIAETNGVDTAKLVADAVALEKAELDAAVKAGTMTDAQRTQELSGLQARFEQALTETATMGHDGPGGPGGKGFGGGAPDMAQALAELSGKDESAIMTQIRSGKTFEQLAKSYGVSTDALIAKAAAIEKAELDAAVKAGTMTGAQRTEILSGLQAHLEDELTESHTGDHGVGPGAGDGTQAPSTSSSPSTSGTSQSF